jgi:hypothetical protein
MHEHHQPHPSVLDLKRIEDDQQLSFSTRSIPLLARRITNETSLLSYKSQEISYLFDK